MRAGRPSAPSRTSGSSSSATRCSSSRSRTRSTSASRTSRRGRWRSSARRSSRGRAAPSSREELGLGERLLASHPGPETQRAGAARREPERPRGACSRRRWPRIYLEHGFEAVAGPIVAAFEQRGSSTRSPTRSTTRRSSRRSSPAAASSVSYTLLASEGPAHERTFTAAALVDGVQAGVGRGGSKKDAEQEAAREALARPQLSSRRYAPVSDRSE